MTFSNSRWRRTGELHSEQSRSRLGGFRARRHPSNGVNAGLATVGDDATTTAAPAAERERGRLPETFAGSRHMGTGDGGRHAVLNTYTHTGIHTYIVTRRNNAFRIFLVSYRTYTHTYPHAVTSEFLRLGNFFCNCIERERARPCCAPKAHTHTQQANRKTY